MQFFKWTMLTIFCLCSDNIMLIYRSTKKYQLAKLHIRKLDAVTLRRLLLIPGVFTESLFVFVVTTVWPQWTDYLNWMSSFLSLVGKKYFKKV